MIALERTSRVGFGAYRVSVEVEEHRRALHAALDAGCNLIDTASTYADGRSEELIGRVLRERSGIEAFVISKAGYIEPEDAELFATLPAARRELESAGPVPHSIHPDFLAARLRRTLARLGRERLDGFLLHNPEYYFGRESPPPSADELQQRITRAFAFLEEQVAAGALRYYGISSNTFSRPTSEPRTTDLSRVAAAARAVSSANHFRLIEFPFNLLEAGASLPWQHGRSLIERARELGIVTLGNRPLNARRPRDSSPIRLHHDPRAEGAIDDATARLLGAAFEEVIDRRLREVGVEVQAGELPVVAWVRDHFAELPDTASVTALFEEQLGPFLLQLYPTGIPESDRRLFQRLRSESTRCALRTMNRSADEIRRELVASGVLPEQPEVPLPVLACQRYLAQGVEHVLVGMRRREYVGMMSPLLR